MFRLPGAPAWLDRPGRGRSQRFPRQLLAKARESFAAGCRIVLGRQEENIGFEKERAMKKLISAALFLLFAAISAAALAEIRTVTLSVSGMT